MNVSQWMPVVALVLGAAVIVTGFLKRRRGGYSMVLLGAALVIGPLSPLLKGHVPVPAQIAFSLAAIAFTLAGVDDSPDKGPLARTQPIALGLATPATAGVYGSVARGVHRTPVLRPETGRCAGRTTDGTSRQAHVASVRSKPSVV